MGRPAARDDSALRAHWRGRFSACFVLSLVYDLLSVLRAFRGLRASTAAHAQRRPESAADVDRETGKDREPLRSREPAIAVRDIASALREQDPDVSADPTHAAIGGVKSRAALGCAEYDLDVCPSYSRTRK